MEITKIEIINYSYSICPVCWKKKDDSTTYTHRSCWEGLNKREREYLFSEFNPYQPKSKTGRKYVTVNKDWRKLSNEERDE